MTQAARLVPAAAMAVHPVRGRWSEAIDGLFRAWDKPGSPGAILAVIKDGAVVHQQGYGLAVVEHGLRHTPTTRFRIASVTKHFLSVVALLLQDEGKLSLDDSVRKYLPELPDYRYTVTLRQMLTMSSGIRDLGETLTLSGVMTTTTIDAAALHEFACRLTTLNFPPATQISYSNTNYRLVQAVVERLTGQSLAELLRQRIFAPMGMTMTQLSEDQGEMFPEMAGGYWFDEGRIRLGRSGMHYSGSGGIVSCLADMLLWHQAFRDGGPFRRGLMGELERLGRLGDGRSLDYALGLTVTSYRGLRTVGHGGSLPGFKTQLMRFPEHDLGVIILANREDAVPYALARQIGDAVLAEHMRPTLAVPAGSERLAGTYIDKATGYTLDLKLAEGTLKASFLGADETLEPTPDGGFKQTGGHMGIVLTPPAATGRPQRWRGTIGWGLAVEWTPVEAFQPAANELVAYLGRYVSPETGAVHQIAIRDGHLAIRMGLGPHPTPWAPCEAIIADVFRFVSKHMQWTARPALRFRRGKDGTVVALELSANRSRDLLFERMA
ncbi:MAG: serine hydrolase [Proteobacteria bacterium]|nr:serine hydrolase [Pseudomonadota bacterium]